MQSDSLRCLWRTVYEIGIIYLKSFSSRSIYGNFFELLVKMLNKLCDLGYPVHEIDIICLKSFFLKKYLC